MQQLEMRSVDRPPPSPAVTIAFFYKSCNDDGDHIMVMSLIGDDACDENDGEITILSFNPSNESSLKILDHTSL